MWKVVTSSNLNPSLKLFFYSSILANNNLLLKIYCENIVVAFLNCIFPFFLSIIHTFPLFFLFLFSWFFSTTHVYPLSPSSPFCFLYFPLHSPTSLPLSFCSSLSLPFFFFFYLIPKHYPALSVIRNGERGRERKNRWVRWLCSAAPSLRSLCLCTLRFAAATRLPPQRSPDGRWLMSFFFFFLFCFYCYGLINFKIMLLNFYFDYAWV